MWWPSEVPCWLRIRVRGWVRVRVRAGVGECIWYFLFFSGLIKCDEQSLLW